MRQSRPRREGVRVLGFHPVNVVTRCELMWRVPSGQSFTWVGARSLAGDEARLVEGYLALEEFSCCSVQAGFFIDVDGRPWSDEGTVDEIWMTMCWFLALGSLLRGEASYGPSVGPWEESRLTWQRHGDNVVMEDVHHGGTVCMPKVEVSLADLARRIHSEGVVLSQMVRDIRTELRRRTYGAPLHDRLLALDGHLPGEGEGALALIDELGALLDPENRRA